MVSRVKEMGGEKMKRLGRYHKYLISGGILEVTVVAMFASGYAGKVFNGLNVNMMSWLIVLFAYIYSIGLTCMCIGTAFNDMRNYSSVKSGVMANMHVMMLVTLGNCGLIGLFYLGSRNTGEYYIMQDILLVTLIIGTWVWVYLESKLYVSSRNGTNNRSALKV